MQTGDIIEYTLAPSEQPIEPTKLWHAKVIAIQGRYIYVESIEPGYEGMKEWIGIRQVKQPINPVK